MNEGRTVSYPNDDLADTIDQPSDSAQMKHGFWSVWTMVDGAVDDEQDIPASRFDAYVEKVEKEATEDGLETDLYVLWHDHAPKAEDSAEDVCIQYAQDLRPWKVWNSDHASQTDDWMSANDGARAEDFGGLFPTDQEAAEQQKGRF